MSMRLTVIRGVLFPRLLFGAEIYGMNRELTNRIQGLLNKAQTTILGDNMRTISVGLWAEMGLDPICAMAAARRARAFGQCGQLRTWVRELVNQPLQSRQWTWSIGIPR